MGIFDRRGTAGALEDLLDRERRAALDGRLDVLERLLAQKERLLEDLARADADAEMLARLKAKLERNEALLAGMEEGVRAALERVRSERAGSGPLRTYTADGAARTLGAGRGPGGRRA